MADLKFLLDMDRTSVLELKLGTYIRGDRGQQGIQGEDGPPGTLTADDQATLQAAVDHSAASASAAQQSQGAAAGSAAAAQSSASQAAGSVTAAAASATQSAQSAGAAAQSASDAAAAQSNVAASANAAADSATAAAGSATAAAGSVTAAAAQVTAATTQANNAAGSATTAGNQASAAAGSATAAAGSATAAGNSATQAAQAALAFPYRNLLYNARFQVNRRIYAGGAVAAAYAYTVDRWRVVVAGQAAPFTAAPGPQAYYYQVACPAGGFETIVDGIDIFGGQYVINWQGTATCQMGPVGSATALTKGQVVTLTAGTSVQFRFSGGTLWLPQLEPGTIPTAFEVIPYSVESERCGAYARVVSIDHASYQMSGSQNSIYAVNFPFMRKVPTNGGLARNSNPTYGGGVAAPPTFNFGYDYINVWVAMTPAGGAWFVTNYLMLLTADL